MFCTFCNVHFDGAETLHECKPTQLDEMQAMIRDMSSKVSEIHAFAEQLARLLDNPMLAAMLPPSMRG